MSGPVHKAHPFMIGVANMCTSYLGIRSQINSSVHNSHWVDNFLGKYAFGEHQIGTTVEVNTRHDLKKPRNK